MGHIYKVVVSL